MANTLQRIVTAVVLLIGILFFYPLSRWLVPYDIGVRAVPDFGYALSLMLFYTDALGREGSGSGLKFSGKKLWSNDYRCGSPGNDPPSNRPAVRFSSATVTQHCRRDSSSGTAHRL